MRLSPKHKLNDWRSLMIKIRSRILSSMLISASSLPLLPLPSFRAQVTYSYHSFRSLAKAELQQEAQNKERRHEFKKLQKKKLTRRSRIIGALFSSVSHSLLALTFLYSYTLSLTLSCSLLPPHLLTDGFVGRQTQEHKNKGQ